MANWLKQGAVATHMVGPIVDGSGIAAGSLNLLGENLQISKNGAAFATLTGVATAFPEGDGYYRVGLAAADLDTLGHLMLKISGSLGVLPHREDYAVVATVNAAWDAIFGSDRMHVDVREVNAAIPTVNIVQGVASISDKSGFSLAADQSAVRIGTVTHVAAVGDKTGYGLAADQSAVRIGTVAHVAAIGDKSGYSLAADQTAVRIGTVTHVAGGIIPTVGLVQEVGSVRAGAIGTVSHAAGIPTVNAIGATAQNDIADAVLSRDLDQVEATMALHSLGSAGLKAVSRVRDNAGTLEVYRTNGTTLHMSQTVTVGSSNQPVDEVTVGA